MKKISFCEIDEKVPVQSGIYEIYTNDGTALKVGIGTNLKRRLIQHRDSRQNRLKLVPGGSWSNPSDVVSKASILAKHLFFDRSITTEFDLKKEEERQEFLKNNCYILFEMTETREVARNREQNLEDPATYRYVGRVVIR